MIDACTYVHVSCCGTPYYVGAGRLRRARNFYKGRDNWLGPEEFTEGKRKPYAIIYEATSRGEAFALERELIGKYGRMDLGSGTLYNRVNGPGIRDSNRGPMPESTRLAIGEALRGRRRSARTRDKISQALSGRVLSAAHKCKIRKNMTKTAITCDGVTQSITEWSRMIGVSSQVIRYRLSYGWSVERALKTPVLRK